MRELTDIGYVRELLGRHGTRTKKGLGQNFLVNPSVCPRMANACGADKDGGALEIGCGVGVLTRELSRVAGKVVCVELDASLFPILDETLEDCGNVELVQGDILKIDLDALITEKFGDMPVAYIRLMQGASRSKRSESISRIHPCLRLQSRSPELWIRIRSSGR